MKTDYNEKLNEITLKYQEALHSFKFKFDHKPSIRIKYLMVKRGKATTAEDKYRIIQEILFQMEK